MSENDLSENGPFTSRHSRSLRVIGTETGPSGTYDFLLVIHSNFWAYLICHFRDKRRFWSTNANFSYIFHVFNAPAEGLP